MSEETEVKMVVDQLPEYIQFTVDYISGYAQKTSSLDARIACRDILEAMRNEAQRLANESRIARKVTLPAVEAKDVKDLGVF